MLNQLGIGVDPLDSIMRPRMPTVAPGPQSIGRAAQILLDGGVVAFPTETVYGLGADTLNPQALERVYQLKGRPFDNPLIAHVLGSQTSRQLVRQWDDRCEALTERFWPGPLTLVVAKADKVPDRATAGFETIALRAPAHPVARALLQEFGGPISAPSANRSGHVSPTRAEHVADDFADVPALLILDGGPCDLGIESTVLDVSCDTPRILRPGSISASAIAAVMGTDVEVEAPLSQTRSPGTSQRHYAPRTRTELVDAARLQERAAERATGAVILAISVIEPPQDDVIQMPNEANAYAAGLYDALRRADQCGASVILVENPTGQGPIWEAVRNRLERAAVRA